MPARPDPDTVNPYQSPASDPFAKAADDPVPDPADLRPLKGAWLVVGLLCVVGCLNYLDRVMLNTMHDSLIKAFAMREDQYGLLTTVFLVVYAFCSPLGGWCSDRFGRSRIIILSLALWSVVTWLTAYAQTYNQLLLTRAFMGLSEACYIPAALALIADYHRGSTRSLATGLHMTGVYIGMAMGGVGGWMAEHHSWSTAFWVFGVFGIVYAVVLMFLLKEAPAARAEAGASVPQSSPMEALGTLAANRKFWIVCLHWGLLGFGGWAFMTWMPVFLREHFKLSQTAAGFTANSYMQAAAFAGVLIGGRIADMLSRKTNAGRIRVPMVALAVCSPFVVLSAHTSFLWVTILCLIIYGFGRGCSDANMMPILCQVAEPRHRATGYGVLNFFSCIIGASGSYLGGWLREREVNVSWLLMGSGVLVLVSALLLLVVKPDRRG